jgi:serine phosphatase RsbU (regulator of sigma subunit)
LGSLKTRLRWSYAIVSVIPLTLLGITLIAINLSAQRQSVARQQATTANWVAREIQTSLSSVDEQLLKLGPQLGPDRSTTEILDAIAALRTTMPDIIDVAVLSQTGRERVHVSQLRGYYDAELIDRSADPLVQWTLQTGHVAQGPITFQPHDAILIYPSYAPIFGDTGRVVGAIRVEVRALRSVRTLREAPLAPGSVAYLVDSSGGTVFSTDDGAQRPAPAGLPALLRGPASTGEYADSRGTPVVGAWSPVPVQPDHWWVVVEIPSALAYPPIWRDGLLLAGAVALVIGTAIAWGLYQTRLILRPLEALRAAAATIGTGDLAARLPAHADDEIGLLADEFNRMAEHLQASHTEIEAWNRRLRDGLDLARDIQLGLLPTAPLREMPPLVLRAHCDPAYEIGGDFYTYVPLDDRRMGVAIGDISGSGIPAALMMALVSSTVEAQARATGQPDQLLTALNGQLREHLQANRMNAALLYAIIDLAAARFSVANAGMIPPYLLRDGRVRRLDTRGLPIGLMPDAEYTTTTLDLLPGDLLLLVSDGVLEAHRPGGELFASRRVEQLLAEHDPDRPPEALIAALLDRVDRFLAGAERHDDLTVVVIQPNLPRPVAPRPPHRAEEIPA